jgi:basic amino acid/polyamine antiporter, APA family
VAGLFLLDIHPISVSRLPAAYNLQSASLLLMFAMGGFENASIPTEEVIDPQKSVPRALLASVVLVVVLYLLLQIVSLAALPGLAASGTPLASAARNFLGPGGALLLTIGALLSTTGTNHSNLFVGPRMLYSLGRSGCFPGLLSRLHSRYRTPSVSILLYGLVGWVLAVSSAFTQLAALSALARLAMYTSTCGAVLVLRRRTRFTHRGFLLPGGALIPLLALGVCAWLLTGSSGNQVLLSLAALLTGAALYGIISRRRVPTDHHWVIKEFRDG